MKTVLLTGGAGFIGHYFIDRILSDTDWNIITLDRLDVSGNLNRIAEIIDANPKHKHRIKFIYHDLKAELNSQIRSMIGPVNIILHLAAGSHVDRSISHPIEFLNDNVLGTINLLEYARNLDTLEKFVYFSTDEIFGSAPVGTLFKEYDRYNSTNPYSASKASAEEFCVAYENTFSLPIFITHTMNVFGIRQHPEKYIPKCIQHIRDGETVLIHSDSSCTIPGSRMYIHANDVVDSVMHIINLKEYTYTDSKGHRFCPKFNIAGLEEIDNLEVATTIASVMNKKLDYKLVDFHSTRPGHDLRYALDPSLMKNLGWTPKIKFKDSIENIISWSLQNDTWLRK
jgi:dTDP-glucose 4,6-dehydratase